MSSASGVRFIYPNTSACMGLHLERSRCGSTNLNEALSEAAFPLDVVRSLHERSEGAGRECTSVGRGIDHKGRGPTVKEDLPSRCYSTPAAVVQERNSRKVLAMAA